MQLQDCFSKPQLLPNIPEVVKDLIATFNESEPDMGHIVSELSMDPVLSAKVLRLANSSRFGGVREIGSVKEAAIRLGLERLRTLVIASGLISATKAMQGIDLHAFWNRSFLTAELCRQLAVSAGLPAEQHFTCGMLHDLGKLILVVTFPARADDVATLATRQGRASAEQSLLGFTTADIGAELAQRWQFPEPVVAGLKHQFDPISSGSFSSEAALVFLSTWLLDHGALAGGQEAWSEHLALTLGLDWEALATEPPAHWPEDIAKVLGLEWNSLLSARDAVLRDGSPFLPAD
ncbi:HDOD domain-containing protein [Gallaecimonas xiamenensis]|uniref:HDOD domain-containing protein n=1 Tax=Gallaecimonas xiamenensis 3-C-1 TaxID=745411 RepID=K2JC74_9GAMM|nr:HDOD domain-containing protein [Gallaecimonas xiamenensis]EKE72417.1 hypothetical protein B3C1_11312 [Gallaecimonas xiamenensis 3-C-1]